MAVRTGFVEPAKKKAPGTILVLVGILVIVTPRLGAAQKVVHVKGIVVHRLSWRRARVFNLCDLLTLLDLGRSCGESSRKAECRSDFAMPSIAGCLSPGTNRVIRLSVQLA